MLPKRLQIGDTIGIISPAGTADAGSVQEACGEIRSQGFRTALAPNLFRKTWGYAASVEERASDFHSMITNNNVRMILFGGGEVCSEILPALDFALIQKYPKIICSYSDSTTLLDAIYTKAGLVTYYGASLQTFRSLTDYNRTQFFERFTMGKAGRLQSNRQWEVLRKGKAEGILVGGYLVNFALLAEGSYLPQSRAQQYILFLEDNIRYNKPAAVARYLAHIGQSEFFRQVSGLLFGHYSNEDNPELTQILKRFAERYSIPAVHCNDFGHGANNAILPIGIKASLNTEPPELILEEAAVL